MSMKQILRVIKTKLHVKGFVLGLPWKQRRNVSRKSPIVEGATGKQSFPLFSFLFSVVCKYTN